jgi:hypothetical protein
VRNLHLRSALPASIPELKIPDAAGTQMARWCGARTSSFDSLLELPFPRVQRRHGHNAQASWRLSHSQAAAAAASELALSARKARPDKQAGVVHGALLRIGLVPLVTLEA